MQSQHLFPPRVAYVFHQDFVLRMRESGRCVKSSPAHPRNSEWGSGLDSVVANPCVDVLCSLNHSFSPMKCGIVILEYTTTARWFTWHLRRPHSFAFFILQNVFCFEKIFSSRICRFPFAGYGLTFFFIFIFFTSNHVNVMEVAPVFLLKNNSTSFCCSSSLCSAPALPSCSPCHCICRCTTRQQSSLFTLSFESPWTYPRHSTIFLLV